MKKNKEVEVIKKLDWCTIVFREHGFTQKRFLQNEQTAIYYKSTVEMLNFNVEVMVITAVDKEHITMAQFMESWEHDWNDEVSVSEKCEGRAVYSLSQKHFPVIVLGCDTSDGTIVHECAHIALALCYAKEVKVSADDSSEMFCYTVQFLYENVKELHELHKAKFAEDEKKGENEK